MVDKTRIAAAGAGVVALAGLTAAVKVWRDRRNADPSADPAVVHVTPDGEEWTVQLEHLENGAVHFETKRDAVREGRTFARNHAPSRLIIHRQDGTVQRQHAYEVE